MDYYELSFTYNISIESDTVSDILAAELAEVGFESFLTDGEKFLGYIPEKIFDEEALKVKLSAFPIEDITIDYTKQLVTGRNWNEEWEKNYFKPVRFGNDCIIRASFHEDEPGYAYTILINPKMAFGTGNHETTCLMINEMLKLDAEGKSILDMGCGTAVLAILGSKKGANPVVAVDIDACAYENAQENVRRNNAGHIQLLMGGAEQLKGCGCFDIIFANINRNILLNDIRYYAAKMKAGGLLFLSGFYKEDIPVIESECNKYGITISSYTEKNNWVAVKAIKA